MPSPMPARAITSKRSPIAVRITPIFVYYRRPSPVSRVWAFREGKGRSRTDHGSFTNDPYALRGGRLSYRRGDRPRGVAGTPGGSRKGRACARTRARQNLYLRRTLAVRR